MVYIRTSRCQQSRRPVDSRLFGTKVRQDSKKNERPDISSSQITDKYPRYCLCERRTAYVAVEVIGWLNDGNRMHRVSPNPLIRRYIFYGGYSLCVKLPLLRAFVSGDVTRIMLSHKLGEYCRVVLPNGRCVRVKTKISLGQRCPRISCWVCWYC